MAGKTAILSLKILGDATGAQKSVANTKKDIGGLEKAMSTASKGISRASGLVGVAAGGGMVAGFMEAVSRDGANRQLAASLGLDPAEQATAGKLAGDLYKNAYGGSMEEVNAVIGGVASTLADLSTNGGADVERLSKKALDLAATFPEVGDGISSAGILMSTGLAKNADEAFDLIAGSMQKLPAEMRGELLPLVDEYGQHFAALGIDGTTTMGILGSAASAGAFEMDKMGDALGEFTKLAVTGGKPVAEAFGAIGLDAGEMSAAIAAGGPAAADAFAKTVAGLQTIEDPAAQAAAAIALFGTPLEDMGTDQIPAFLGAIDPAGDAFDSLAGSADKMGETLNAGPSVALETLKRTAMDSFTSMMAAALPVLEPIIGWLQQYAPVIGPIAVGVGALAAAVWIVNGAMTAWNAALAIGRGAVMLATGAQWLFNAALNANPLGIIILLIAALVAGVIWAYHNVDWFREAVDNAGRIAGEVFTNIGKWIDGVIQWLDKMLAPIGGIDGAITGLKAAADTAFGAINSAIQGTIGWVRDAIGWFQGLFGAKNDAASVAVGGADSGGMGAALATAGTAPALSLMGAAPAPAGMMGAAPAPGPGMMGASYGAASTSLAGAVERNAGAGGNHTEINIRLEVKADATTDAVALGDKLLKTINKALAAKGQKKLAPA